MPGFEFLSHIADFKTRARGKSKKEVFQNTFLGIISCIEPQFLNIGAIRKIEITSTDAETLLVDFLNEILYLSETRKEAYQEIEFTFLKDNELKASIKGKKVKSFARHIKAATYHDLKIRRKKDKTWEATVLPP